MIERRPTTCGRLSSFLGDLLVRCFRRRPSGRRLARRDRVNGKRVHAALQFGRKRIIDHAMPGKSALACEGIRDDIDAEMGFSARPVPGVAFVSVGFILNIQAFGGESRGQLLDDDIFGAHGARLERDEESATRFSARIPLRDNRSEPAGEVNHSRQVQWGSATS